MDNFEENSGGDLLMIFVKNPEPGKVKTRLASKIGNEKALKVYQYLLKHTREIALQTNFFRLVTYSDFIDYADLFENEYFLKDEQPSGDLGIRLSVSFEENFEEGYDKIVCIGSDCLSLTPSILEKSFSLLDNMPKSLM